MNPRTAEVLHLKTRRNDEGCLIWLGKLDSNGYGPHRRIYEQTVGPIPAGMQLDHTCHDRTVCLGGPTCPHRSCVDVTHLKVTTLVENVRRGGRGAALECPDGHLYALHGRVDRNGHRLCVPCENRRQRESYYRRRAAA